MQEERRSSDNINGVDVYWEAILKMTELWASSPHLQEPFEELVCRCERHEELEGKRKTSLAATWPLGDVPEDCRRNLDSYRERLQGI